jgi:hypothetical protein
MVDDSLTLKPNFFFGKPKMKIDQYAKNFLLNDNFMPNSHNSELDIATHSIGRNIGSDFIFTKNYCESTEWIISIFDKISKTLVYYCDNANSHSPFNMDASFRINGLSFEVEIKDAPTLIWNYVSLAHLIEAVFGFYLCDKNSPLRICKHCKNIFISKLASTEFCSAQCRNQYNVYKSRAKKD